jgi:hypothetical protein
MLLEVTALPPKKRTAWNKGKPSGRPLPDALKATKWKPGQSGNPSGRPKKSTDAKRLSDAYRIQLQEQCTAEGLEHLTWAEAIAVGMAQAAARGETTAAKELRETTEGKTPENIRIGDPEGKPLERPVLDVHFVTPVKTKKKG